MTTPDTFTRASSVTDAVIDLILAGEILEEMLADRARATAEYRRKYFEDAEREMQS